VALLQGRALRRDVTIVEGEERRAELLEELEGDTFDAARLKELGVVKKLQAGLKILGNGELTRAITVKANIFSEAALKKIQAAGGTAEVIAPASK